MKDDHATSLARAVAKLNVDHYRVLLKTELGDQKRSIVERLLAEEETKLKELMSVAVPTWRGRPGENADRSKRDGLVSSFGGRLTHNQRERGSLAVADDQGPERSGTVPHLSACKF